MKKTFLSLFLLMILLCSNALAFTMPYVVYGDITVDGKAWDGKDIILKEFRTGDTAIVGTNKQGIFQFEISNHFPNYRGGDKFQLDVCVTEEYHDYLGSQCYNNFIIVGEGGMEVDLDLKDVDKVIAEKIFVCWDGSEVFDKDNCPVKPDAVEPIEPVEPEEGSTAWYWVIIGAMIVAIAGILSHYRWGKGFAGLLKYWAKKDPKRALKMLGTVEKNIKEGKYQK